MFPGLKIYRLCLLCMIFCGIKGFAQDFLVLEKMGTKKRHEYYKGDEIIFKLKKNDFFITDEILGLGDSTILFASGSVPLNDIDKVSLSNRKGVLRGTGSSFLVAGIGYMLIDIFNKTIRNGEIYVDEKVARTSGIISGSGLALIILSNKKVRLKKNWRLRIVDIY